MKKLAVTLSLLAIAAGAFAQGSVSPANSGTTLFRTNSLGLSGGSAGTAVSSAGGPYLYEVLTAPSSITTIDASLQALLSAPWSDTGLTASNSGIAGRMNAGSTTVNNWAAGVQQSFVVVGWSASEGSSWAQVSGRLAGAQLSGGVWSGGGLINGGFLGATYVNAGTGTVGFRQAGGVTTAGTIGTPGLFGSAADAQGQPITGLTDLFVVNVPEPTSFALVGLGGAALMIFRRRKV